MPTVAIHTLGCKANQYDSEKLAEGLSHRGFELVPFEAKADAYIVNTCTVTHVADREARRTLRNAHRRNPKAIVIATGCYAQVAPEELAKVEGVNYVIGNDRKERIMSVILTLSRAKGKDPGRSFALRAQDDKRRSRAFINIQDGCNFRCSFCIIPFARGVSRSRTIPDILEEIGELAAGGYHEVVLSGIHIGSYGWDLKPKQTLYDLMLALEKNCPIDKVRLSTLDPHEVSEAMIDLIASSKMFCPHLHIAIQSGHDRILKKMRRRHTTRQLQTMIGFAANKIKNLGFGADVITGFPTEGQREHFETKKLLEDLPLTYLHVFPYSERKGTTAATMADPVPLEVRRLRAQELIELAKVKKKKFWESQLGSQRPAILEEGGDGIWQKATTDNYIHMWVEKSARPKGSLGVATLNKIQEGRILGTWKSPGMNENN